MKQKSEVLREEFLNLNTPDISLFWEVVLWIVGCLAVCLISTHETPVTTIDPECDNQNVPGHCKCPLGHGVQVLRTTDIKE
jgi:hypothetical protein